MGGYSALYQRLPRLLEEVRLSRGDGRYARLLRSLVSNVFIVPPISLLIYRTQEAYILLLRLV